MDEIPSQDLILDFNIRIVYEQCLAQQKWHKGKFELPVESLAFVHRMFHVGLMHYLSLHCIVLKPGVHASHGHNHQQLLGSPTT